MKLGTYYTDAFFETPSDSVTGNLEPKTTRETASDTATAKGAVRWIHGFDKCPRNVRLALCQYAPKVIEGLATAVRNVSGSLDKSLKEIDGIQSLPGTSKK